MNDRIKELETELRDMKEKSEGRGDEDQVGIFGPCSNAVIIRLDCSR